MGRLRLGNPGWLQRVHSVPTEAGIVAAVLLVWQAARIPVEGTVPQALRHAHEWLALNRTLGLGGLENGVISLVHHPVILRAARWSYANLHIFAIFTFMVAMRATAPDRYPRVRTAFILLHIPALAAIAAFPLGSPYWLPHPPQWGGGAPTLDGSLSSDLRNLTGTVASEHFGYALLIAAGTLWATRRPIAWTVVLYPIWVFLFIVGIGRHYPLDAVVGTLCVAFGFWGAYVLHHLTDAQSTENVPPREPLLRRASLGLGSGLLAGYVNALVTGHCRLSHLSVQAVAAPAAALIALTVARHHQSIVALLRTAYDRRRP
jgi:PAP2 superfamily